MDHHFFPVSTICLMLYLCYFIKFTICFDDPAYLPDNVSITCGSAGTSAAHNGRQWLGDMHPILSSSVQIKGKSTISSVARDSVIADPVPYRNARISRSGFSYVFLVSPGEKCVRLHFNPAPYKGFQKYKDFFTVEAGPFTLLSNFSASITADALGLSSVSKEFCISAEENHPLHIVFTPASSLSGDTYAFVNGIEIITVPLDHSYFHADGDIGAQVVGRKSQQRYVDNSTALEMVSRVNIKRVGFVSSGDDFSDMFGMWGTVPRVKANQINNTTWKIPVDVGFRYLIRLHFSNLGLKFLQETDFVSFGVLIDEVTAYNNMDLVGERDTDSGITYKDYILMLKGRKQGVKHNISVSLQWYSESIDGYGHFTGFEVLKLSNHDNSLASPNPSHLALDSPYSTVQILLSALGHRNAFVTLSVTVIALANIIVHKLREIWEDRCIEEEIKPSARAERFCRRFTLAEIQVATKNFSYHLIIGKGGFGNVYKGLIDNGKETVAVKRLKFDSRQGGHEFLAEIETLSELRHNNLVSLMGYCNEQREMILVYEYMASGTLGDHLYKVARKGNSCASLTWKQCLNICIGAGRGLDYLHTGNGIIHRDVKVSNILLDENFIPKVSDFGLVKHENLSNLQSHVSTKVKGTFGYLDPAYFRTGNLTRKSDTYAFGVVLLEVLCGRPALDHRVPDAEKILTEWALGKIREGEVELLVASNLKKEISPNSLKAFVEVVERCLQDEPKKRPTMAQVVLQLEFALEQQDTVEPLLPKEITVDAPYREETNLSVGEHTTWISERTPTSPPKGQTNNQVDYDNIPYRGKHAKPYKPSRIWPWDALWNKVKPSKKKQDVISENCEEGVNFLRFDWAMIASATNHFSPSNIVGEGRSGFVYKALFPSGQIVAVKRLSASINQSLAGEVIKESLMIQKFQHQNILKALGYCIDKEKMILVHEFMENKSLDEFMFGKCQHLQWARRFKIIMGIARGLVYLHREVRIIHGDLNPRHILLDINMNPKISFFESAKIRRKDLYSTTSMSMLPGTIGYTSPEYLRHLMVSIKSDVYSFGVVVLEIVSGKRCLQDGKYIVTAVRKLWDESKVLDMVHESIGVDVSTLAEVEAFKCIQVALLCTQFQRDKRPDMPTVIELLEGDQSVPLPEINSILEQETDTYTYISQ